jgi:hypothetical protein
MKNPSLLAEKYIIWVLGDDAMLCIVVTRVSGSLDMGELLFKW